MRLAEPMRPRRARSSEKKPLFAEKRRCYDRDPVAKRSAKRAAGAPPVRSKGSPAPARAGRNRTYLFGGAAVAALVVAGIVVAVVFAGGSGGTSSSSTPAAIPWAKLPGLQTGPPPWGNDVGTLPGRLPYLDLHKLSAEGTVLHVHQHLDLYVAGRKVALPPGVGIYDNSWITEVHVHDTSGVIHVESPTQRTFVLGQLFGEWGVKLTGSCVGRYCGHVRWWVNGKKMTGDPARLVLRSHQEIVIAAGPPPFEIPKSYAFPAGE